MPLVSVIIPVRDGEAHLRQCLDSVGHQTLTDIEVIVVDDGSRDATAAIAAEFAAADPRFRVVAGPGEGSAGSARNTGLDVAVGDYLSFLDGDDFFAPTLLAELHRRAVADDADVVTSKFALFHQGTGEFAPANWSLRLEYLPRTRPFSPRQIADQLFFSINPAAWNKLFRREFIVDSGLRFQPLRRANDACFTYLALARATRISYLDRALVNYRTGNEASLQGSLDEAPLEFVQALDGIRAGLVEAGLYDTYERGFVNLALSMSLTNLKRPRTAAGFLALYGALRKEVFPRFGILGRPPGYFLRADLPRGLDDVLRLSPEAYLLRRAHQSDADAAQARSELNAALRQNRRRETAIRPPADATAAGHPGAGATTPHPATPLTSQQHPPTPLPSRPHPGAGPEVSVIVPIHNTEPFLQQCLDSILAQPGVALEVICVDDGSTDGSPVLLAQYAARDERVRVLRQDNAGPSVARNAGLDVASGEFVCFVDSDDYWRSDALAGLVERARRESLDLLLFDAVSVREPGVDDDLWRQYERYYTRRVPDGVRTGVELVADLRQHHAYRASVCLALVSRDLIEVNGLRFHPGISHEDDLFTFGLMLDARRTTHDPTALYTRRIRPGSIVTTGSRVESARGYFVACLGMQRALLAHHPTDSRSSAALGGLVYRAFRSARADLVELPEDLVEALHGEATGPDAEALFLVLRQEWRDEQARRLLAKRLRHAERRQVAAPTPLLARVKRRVVRLLRRIR